MNDLDDLEEDAHDYDSELSERDREKYHLHVELARGGMGVVLRGHDKELGRDVAIKVLDPALADREQVRQRFVEEAQIGGQLQHPGIVPVYELGLMADERPWFAMKLVKGRTLAELLAERPNAEADRGKLLGIFEAVCQTVAYAHSKDVVHRDLKPANVMVGAFGEVQVVDWGLAKVLGRDGGERSASSDESLLTVIETVRSKEGSSHDSASIVGSVLGTPAYMPPEQAQGNIDRLDARADVFALGAILCEILTGAPPYVREEGGRHVLELAADGQLEPALARIESASTEDELKELCRRCLAPARGTRPKDASEVAEAIHDHIVGSEERAHRAELEVAEQKFRAERAARRVQMTLMASGLVLLVVAGGGGAAWWVKRQEQRRVAELSRAFDELQPEILAASRDGELGRALELAQAAQRMVQAGEPNEELRQRASDAVVLAEERLREQGEREAEARRLADFAAFLERMATGFSGDDEQELAAYEAGFGAFGIVLDDPGFDAALEPHRDTELGIRMARGFDGWARTLRGQEEADPFRVDLLTGVGLDLDPDPVRADVRLALVSEDVSALLELYESFDLDALPAETLYAIGSALRELNRGFEGAHVLSRGSDLYPDDFLLAHDAGRANAAQGFPIRARRYLRSAASMRPGNPNVLVQLSSACMSLGDYVGGLEYGARARELDPAGNADPSFLVTASWYLGRWEEAHEYMGEVLELHPDDGEARVWRVTVEVYAGMRPLEEALEEIAELGEELGVETGAPTAYASPLVVVPDGVEPDPERALDMIESGGLRDTTYSRFVAAATYARLGRGDEVLRALEPDTRVFVRVGTPDRFERAVHELLLAVGHRLLGDSDRAAYHLSWARQARYFLVLGRQDAWGDSWLEMVFEQFEPMAR